MNYLKEYGRGLIRRGYKIIPLPDRKKYPAGVKSWQKLDMTEADVLAWVDQGFSGVGILCASTPAVDLDIRDKEMSMWMAAQVCEIAGAAPIRVGLPPKALLPFKTLKPFRKMSSKRFKDAEGVEHQVEILGEGNQFVAFGVHPDTGKPYRWNKQPPDWDDLPTLGRVQAAEIIQIFEEEAARRGWVSSDGLRARDGGGDRAHPRPGAEEVEEVEGVEGAEEAAAAFDALPDPPSPRMQIDTDTMTAHLKHLRAEDLDYDDWLKVGMGIWHQLEGSQEGYEMWRAWSERSPKHDETHMEAKWASMKPEPGQRPVTFRTVIKMSADARMAADPLSEFLRRFVFIACDDTVHDLYGPTELPAVPIGGFRRQWAGLKVVVEVPAPLKLDPDRVREKKVPVAELWLNDVNKKVVHSTIYVPNSTAKGRVVKGDGGNFLNLFRMPEFPLPSGGLGGLGGGRLDIFLRHMEYLFPVEEEREWFISWMALNIQHPENRCRVTPLHVSVHHGTGRGWLVDLMYKLLGPWNCRKIGIHDLAGGSQFNGYLDRSLLCCIEEVFEGGGEKFKTLDRVRDVLTEDYLHVNAKYGKSGTQRVYTNFFFMSNHVDALAVNDEDRRINVFLCNEEPRDNAYYVDLYGWSKARKGQGETGEVLVPSEGVCALWHWLNARDLSGFNWQRSLDSDSRREMIEYSRSDIESLFLEFIKDPPWPVMTIRAIQKCLDEMSDGDEEFYNLLCSKKSVLQLSKLLMKFGKSLGQVRLYSSRRSPRRRCWQLTKKGTMSLEDVRKIIQEQESFLKR